MHFTSTYFGQIMKTRVSHSSSSLSKLELCAKVFMFMSLIRTMFLKLLLSQSIVCCRVVGKFTRFPDSGVCIMKRRSQTQEYPPQIHKFGLIFVNVYDLTTFAAFDESVETCRLHSAGLTVVEKNSVSFSFLKLSASPLSGICLKFLVLAILRFKEAKLFDV